MALVSKRDVGSRSKSDLRLRWAKAGTVIARFDKCLDHLSVDTIAVEGIQHLSVSTVSGRNRLVYHRLLALRSSTNWQPVVLEATAQKVGDTAECQYRER